MDICRHEYHQICDYIHKIINVKYLFVIPGVRDGFYPTKMGIFVIFGNSGFFFSTVALY